MKRFVALLLCVVMALTAFGCAESEGVYVPTGDALVYDPSQTPTQQVPTDQNIALAYYPERSMNPYSCTDNTNRVLFSLLYQGLFTVDRNYTVSPILCQSYSRSADMRSYTFRIAQATFSDGTAVTAADVAASLNAAKAGSFYSGRFQHVTGITATQDAVTIKLDTPCGDLPILLDIPIVKASEVNAAQPIGTGPYILDDSNQGRWLRRRQDWWCNAQLAVQASFISLVPAEGAKHIRDQFEYNKVSLVCADPVAMDYADFRYDHELWNCETGTFLYLVCNSRSKLFANETVRRALTHAINRDVLVQTYYRGLARSATLPASPQFPHYSANLAEQYGYDSQKFTDAIAQLSEEERTLKILVNKGDKLKTQIAQSLADMLTQYGLTVTIQLESGDTYIEHLRWGSYDLYLAQTRLSANMDLSAFFAPGGSLNYGGLTNSGIHAMCLNAIANSGNYASLHKRIMDEAWLCPLLFTSYGVYTARGVMSSLTPARDNIFQYTVGRTMTDAFFTE